jgi:DNA polymerase-4
MCDRVAARLLRAGIAGGTVVLKLKTSGFQTITRNRQLLTPTQRGDVLFETAQLLIRKEADGQTFRLIGIGVADIISDKSADPPDLFRGSGR